MNKKSKHGLAVLLLTTIAAVYTIDACAYRGHAARYHRGYHTVGHHGYNWHGRHYNYYNHGRYYNYYYHNKYYTNCKIKPGYTVNGISYPAKKVCW